jgi:uncharacterized membrane protein YvbJ
VCPKCGNYSSADAVFCPECGAKLRSAPQVGKVPTQEKLPRFRVSKSWIVPIIMLIACLVGVSALLVSRRDSRLIIHPLRLHHHLLLHRLKLRQALSE